MNTSHSRIRAGLLAVAALSMTGAGCTSYRIDNTLRPGAVTVRTGQPRYAIAKATLTIAPIAQDEGLIDFGVYDISSEVLTQQLADASVKMRPDVFAAGPDAIPVEVSVTRSLYESFMGAGGCVSCITLTIYPLRMASDTAYDVVVTLPGEAGARKSSAPVPFMRKETSWMSILPGGWIPVPGGSGERALGDDRAIALRNKTMLAACVEAAAIALLRTDASSWRDAEPAAPPAPAPTPAATPAPAAPEAGGAAL